MLILQMIFMVRLFNIFLKKYKNRMRAYANKIFDTMSSLKKNYQ